MSLTRIIAGLISILCYIGAAFVLWDVMNVRVIAGVILVLSGAACAYVSNSQEF
jgi:hypothetical protein